MISSEASGVLFTGNPLTTATDEVVINSSWGLGEAVVSGIVTPDSFILKACDTLRVREKVLGTKELRIRRDLTKAHGTVTESTPDSERERFSLTDEQAIKLARLGLRVQEKYEGFPQDIEWGFEHGTFYLLQSRPITGVEFSWDADVDDWQMFPEADGTTWTRSLADENWTGAISPLMYSWRGYSWAQGHEVRNEKLYSAFLESCSQMTISARPNSGVLRS
jgi:pyruvate,water dikinase